MYYFKDIGGILVLEVTLIKKMTSKHIPSFYKTSLFDLAKAFTLEPNL